ncbi:MAG: hypothetical protein ABIJ96_03375 [Elusimicrobiota bacterium]
MTQEEILRDALRLLGRLGIEYMLTGSFASNVHGRVRSTFDADIVVVLKPAQLKMLIDSLGADYYVDNVTLPEVQESGGKLNSLHRPSGLKIDFFLARTARDREALARRRTIQFGGAEIAVIAPEDLILAKLLWAKEGGSARQVEDARGIAEVMRAELDMEYLGLKARENGLENILAQILR